MSLSHLWQQPDKTVTALRLLAELSWALSAVSEVLAPVPWSLLALDAGELVGVRQSTS